MNLRPLYLFFAALAVLLVGCGGGETPQRAIARDAGRATVTVIWPATTRLIPLAANAITVTLTQGTKTVAAQTLSRPAGSGTVTVTFNSLPPGTTKVTATAYPNADGTGTAQASATTSITIQSSKDTPFSLTMNSTIDHLESSPTSLALNVGDSTAVTVTAKDAAGNIVLIKPQTLDWISSDPTVATVSSTGTVNGIAAGGTTAPVQITATETESNKHVSIPVTVAPPGVLIASEPFDDAGRVGLALDGEAGGTGLAGFWGIAAGSPLYVVSENLTFGNLSASGNSVEATLLNGGLGPLPSGESRGLASPLGQSGTVVYFSFLLRPLVPIQSSSSSDYCGLLIGNGLFVGKIGTSDFYGLSDGARTSQSYVGTQVSAQQNTTAFLVVRATFKDGVDQFDLWVDPMPGKPLPTLPDATKTDLDLGTVGTIGLYSGIVCQFDELRVGTSYASVAPTQ